MRKIISTLILSLSFLFTMCQTVTINGSPFFTDGNLSDVLNEHLPYYAAKTVVVELEPAHYTITDQVNIPRAVYTRFILNGNHATIVVNVDSTEHAFFKPRNTFNDVTSSADTYQEFKDFTIIGNGYCSAICLQGGYQSLIDNVDCTGFSNCIDMQFQIQCTVQRCNIKRFTGFAIRLGTIPGTDPNTSQCNVGSVFRNRIFASNGEAGILVQNSNLVKLEGNVIEGAFLKMGVWFENQTSTVTNFIQHRTHFESKWYSDAAIVINGNIFHYDLSSVYYHGKSGKAIRSYANRLSRIYLRDTWDYSWHGLLETEYSFNGINKKTYWNLYSVRKDVKGLFGQTKPWYVWNNGSRKKVR